jgi:hypothetical protein
MGTSNKSLAVILNLILLTILGTWAKATFVDGVDVSKIIKIVCEEGDYSDLSVFFIVVFIPLIVFYLVYFLISKVFKKDVSSLFTKSLTVGCRHVVNIYNFWYRWGICCNLQNGRGNFKKITSLLFARAIASLF